MKKYSYFILSLTLLLITCVNSQNEKELEKYFDSTEIKELSIIIKKFESLLKNKIKDSNNDSLYKQFLKKMNENKSPNDIKEFFNSNKNIQLKDLELFNIFDKIWIINKGYNIKEKKSTKEVNINIKGEYMKLLESKLNNNYIDSYYSSLLSSGGISPSSTTILQRNYNNIDLSNNLNKLIIAIHFLTLNDESF